MDHRPRPSSPYVPPDEQPGGWVVAGEEQRGWAPSPEDGWYATPHGPGYGTPDAPGHGVPYDPGYGGQWYGEPAAPDYPPPEPRYPPDPAYPPTSGHPTQPGYPAAQGYPAEQSYPAEPGYPAEQSYPAEAGYRPDPVYPPPSPRPDPRPPDPHRLGRQQPPPPPGPPDEPPPPGWAAALLWTIGAFLVPALVYLGWALALDGTAPDGCLDATGAACPPPRAEAVDRLVDALPALGGALTLALLVAVVVRRIAADWRGATVGLAAAVIGAGLATLVAAVLS